MKEKTKEVIEVINKEEYPNKTVEFFKGIGTILLYFIFALIGGIIFGNYYESSNKLIAGLSQLGTYLIMLAGFCLIYRKRLIEDFKNFQKDNINIALKNWLCGLGIMFISNLIISFIVKDIAVNESANRELLNNLPITNMITMIIIGPLIEEIAFRASFKKAFTKWYTFAIVTGFLFGLAHIAEYTLLELLFIIPYGALGFFFAKAFYETNNIYTSYIAHALHNALCILLIMLY
ncbi:MAG: CPBP family intramembrane metalloprotease [Bacilli bacterium]|jgi:membrane protease YdiL (CAAX protease family)|nr:CPBP family intramembrane metalloprotease [Bacilli bacterium]